VRKFIFSATASDDTCTSWISVFDDQAQVLLGGAKADDLYSELELGNQGAFDAFFTRANYTDWIMTCKVKQEMANDEMKLKTSLMSLHPMDYAKEGRSLLNAIIKL
jgi:replication factor A1